MSWNIKCHNKNCKERTCVENIVDLIEYHRDSEGWFLCKCGSTGYIEKSFKLQEEGEVWEPYLRGIITLGNSGETYQPFVFIVSYKPIGISNDVWFSYYKDLRPSGGKLKLGYGPGGPPVLRKSTLIHLLKTLKNIGYFSEIEIRNLIEEQ